MNAVGVVGHYATPFLPPEALVALAPFLLQIQLGVNIGSYFFRYHHQICRLVDSNSEVVVKGLLQVWLLYGHFGSIGVFCSECHRGGLRGGHIVDVDSNGKALVVLEHGHGIRNFEGVNVEGAKKDHEDEEDEGD